MSEGRRTTLAGVLRRGWSAPPKELLTGSLAALAVSGSLAIGLGVSGLMPTGLIAFVAGALQLALAYGIAGALTLRRTRGEHT